MKANNRRRLIHRDCWPFSELFLPRRSTAVTQGRSGREGRPPEPHTSACLPNNYRVAVRGFSFGILSVQKLRPPQKKSEVSELALIECGITDLEQDLLAEFPLLQTLRLDYNNLTYIKQNWFVNTSKTESDIKPAQNITHLCQQAWENVSTVRVALRGDTTLQTVPMGVDRSCHPQIVAVVLSDVISKENRTRLYDHEEMTNVTCLVNTWEEETYQHVFPAPLSSTPDGTVCPRKTQATMTPDSTLFTREGMPLTTIEPKITTTKRQNCCSRSDQQGPLAGAHGTAPNRTTQQSGEQQYSEIPDEYYDQQNTGTSTTSQTDHDYSQIPDGYFNYYNTRPGAENEDDKNYSVRLNSAAAEVVVPSSTRLGDKHPSYNTAPQVWRDPQNYQILRVPQDDKDYSVRLNTATAEVVLPSSTRLGDKHPSYNTAPQVWRDPQNYQIPARGHEDEDPQPAALTAYRGFPDGLHANSVWLETEPNRVRILT
ncbi:regulation of response to stimulus [Branchiostoma belcheri]|nr:regulation of response to stimulus [Branchiostoma belcheri]